MSDVIDLLDTDFFQIGLRFGLAALAVGWGLVFALRGAKRPLAIGGILISAGTIAALHVLGESINAELLAFGLILVGAGVARALKAPDWALPLVVLPGALWLAIGTSVTDLVWVRAAMVVLIPVGGFLITDFEKRYDGMGLGVIFFGLAALGVFVAVPDTEWARVLITVAVPVTFLSWPSVAASLGVEGAYLSVATLMVVTAHGGGPRPASIVGGIACLGLLLLEPIAIAWNPSVVKFTTLLKRNWARAVLTSLPQFVVVALCSRVAARFTREVPALVVVVLVYGVTLAVGQSAVSSSGVRNRAS